MKIIVIFKLFTILLLGSFLLLGCGGGNGESICFGTNCPASGGDEGGGGNGGEGGEGGEGGGEGTEGGGESAQSISANLTYDSLENNISDYRGMFNLVFINQIEPKDLDRHSNLYVKEIIYFNVNATIATKLSRLLDGNTYPNRKCTYEDTTLPYCQEFIRRYYTLPADIISDGILAAKIIFNQDTSTGCAENSGVCDVTLIVEADAKLHNNTHPISLESFRRAFVDNYYLGDQMETALRNIERNATVATLGVYSRYRQMNLTAYREVNETIRRYNDLLPVNEDPALPQIPMKSNGDDGEGAELNYKGAFYNLRNRYETFEENKTQYDVNESNPSHLNYWMSSVSDPDTFNYVTLCQRTKNATDATPDANATNATYTCEEGKGNISARWTVQGKSVNLGW
ncbi:MAG: hypothetical protein LBT96_04090 [Campylobacteraceae bacterium]|jgi:hypothetical protein|nr:hypothetical protein [Campylobacteraceae bacterium]